VTDNVTDYPEDSRSAVLRVAILVTDSDGSWHQLELAQLEDVYRNICVMLDEDLEDEQFSSELDTITSDVVEEIEALADEDEAETYWQTCLAPIVSEDIQQLTVGAALALSVGDGEIDAEELSGLRRLCDTWDVTVKDAVGTWTD